MAEESRLEAHFRREVRKLGGLVEKIAPTTKGMPDRMILISGRIFLVELKALRGRLSEKQKDWHDKAAQRNVRVFTLMGRTEVDRWIERLAEALERKAQV